MKWKGYNTFWSLLICIFLGVSWDMTHNRLEWPSMFWHHGCGLCLSLHPCRNLCKRKHDQSSCEVKLHNNLAVRHSHHTDCTQKETKRRMEGHRWWPAGKPCSPWDELIVPDPYQSQPFPGMWSLILEQALTLSCGLRALSWGIE